jgi:hypothetical protein
MLSRNPFYLRSKFLRKCSTTLPLGRAVAIPSIWGLNSYLYFYKFLTQYLVAIPSIWGLNSYIKKVESQNKRLVAIPSIWGLNSYKNSHSSLSLDGTVAIPSIWGLNSYRYMRIIRYEAMGRNPFYLRSKFLRRKMITVDKVIVAIPSIWGLNSYHVNPEISVYFSSQSLLFEV